MVDICRQESARRVTEAALDFSNDMSLILTGSRRAIVAAGAGTGVGAMIETTTGESIQEVIGIVAFITGLRRGWMKRRLTNGQHTVVALAADPEDLLVIDGEDRSKPQGRMTGLTGVTGCQVVRRLARYLIHIPVVTLLAIG